MLYSPGNPPPFVEGVAGVFALLDPVVVYTGSPLGRFRCDRFLLRSVYLVAVVREGTALRRAPHQTHREEIWRSLEECLNTQLPGPGQRRAIPLRSKSVVDTPSH